MLSELLREYGWLAILVGTFFEGETILVMGGFAAHQGYLSLGVVVLAAFCGSLAGDQCAFLLGRRYGKRLLERFPRVAPGVARGTAMLERRGTLLLVGFRFVYGVRNAVPFAAGLSAIAVPRFVMLNAIGAAIWAGGVATAGYLFGSGFMMLLERAKRFEEHALGVMLALGAIAGLVHLFRHYGRRRSTREAGGGEKTGEGSLGAGRPR